MGNKRKFNPPLRARLEFNIKRGVSISDIADMLETSRRTVYTELALGLSDEDREKRLWKNYSAELAQKTSEQQAIEKLRK